MSATSFKLRRMVRMLVLRCSLPAITVYWVPSLHRWDLVAILAVLTIWMIAETAIENEIANCAAVSSSHDRNSRQVILGAHLIAWWAPLINCLLWPGSPGIVWFSVGAGVTLIGASLRVIAVHTLGSDFTAHVRVCGNQQLCESGVYGLVRHPAYVALFLLNIGPSLATQAWAALFLVAGASLLANSVRVSVEEEALTKYRDMPYKSYCLRVPRWFPSVGRQTRAHRADF